ncbi:DUF6777 domain-containing protein [Streptomyces sp. NPDC057116]|uniref:DUF6777 domain-containing protein n=1 Tax=Streptomyces sp. NPDC057116 TaxID=3346023 RepID=UPI00363CFE81
MRSPMRLLLAAGLLVAGCGGNGDGGTGEAAGPGRAGSREVRLQPAGAPGPHPFTASTVLPSSRAAAPPAPRSGGGRGPRTVPGSAPGLYAGVRSAPSCDVERQVALLTADDLKARAFAQAAGIGPAGIGSWLRGLTPVTLSADTRVTGHGYRGAAAVPFQSVLQAGTAVLVDQYGAPRVRCACGNPLRSPVVTPGDAVTGRPWDGYDPGRVVIVDPTQQVVHSLIIVDVRNNRWLERLTGTGADRDGLPEVPPPYAPGERDLASAPAPSRPREQRPPRPPAPADCPTETGGTRTVPPGCPTPPPPPPPPVVRAPDGAGEHGGPDLPAGPDGGPEGPGSGPAPGLPDEPGVPDGAGVPEGAEVPEGAGVPDGSGVPDEAGQPQDMPLEPAFSEG